jgi:hypothetical protein
MWKAFLDEVIHPFNARLRTPLVPTVRDIFADGDSVITLFDAAVIAADGIGYRNTYTWYLWLRDGKVFRAIAFFDTRHAAGGMPKVWSARYGDGEFAAGGALGQGVISLRNGAEVELTRV